MNKPKSSSIYCTAKDSVAIAVLAMAINFSLPAAPAQADVVTGLLGGGLVGGIIGGTRGAVAGAVVGGVAGHVVEDNKRRNRGGRGKKSAQKGNK